jgi:WD40 repeat protein
MELLMIRLLTCAQGHFWETAEDGNGETPTAPPCPVCGTPAETLPLLDLAPSDVPAPLPPPPPPPPSATRDDKGRPVIPGYEISEDIGRGPNGMMLYKAKQSIVGRTVLIKVVEAKNDAGQLAWGSLRSEAYALGRVTHPNIVQILEAGEREKQLFYNVVECPEGQTLARLMAEKPIPWRQAVRLIEVLARAVQQAHVQSVTHRSLKPSCIVLVPIDQTEPVEPPFCTLHSTVYLPKIADFGMARRPVEGETNDLELQPGIPSYLSPEQAWGRAKEIGPATDVYALGAILYELVTGQPPFKGSRVTETIDQVQTKDVVPPAQLRAGIPADVDAICQKCLYKQPRRRYASAQELADDLCRCAEGRPTKARGPNGFIRAGKWVARQPATATLLLITVLACVAALLALSSSAGKGVPTAIYDRAVYQRKQAEQLAADRAQEAQEAREREQLAAHGYHILLADREFQAGRQQRALEHLRACTTKLQDRWEWRHLHSRALGEKTDYSLRGFEDPVVSMSFSHDSQYLATASGKQVRVWSVSSEKIFRQPKDAAHPVQAVALSPDGIHLAVVSGLTENNTSSLDMWDWLEGREVKNYSFNGHVTGVAYNATGRRLAVVDNIGTVHAMDPDGVGQRVSSFYYFNNRLETAARVVFLDEEGTRVALNGSRPFRLPGEHVPESLLRGHTETVRALAFNPETNRLASGSNDRTARIWNPQSSESLVTLQGHDGPVTGVAFTSDGTRLATSSEDGTVKIWDPATGRELLTLRGFAKGDNNVAFSPDGQFLAVSHGKEVKLLLAPPRN